MEERKGEKSLEKIRNNSHVVDFEKIMTASSNSLQLEYRRIFVCVCVPLDAVMISGQ